MGRKNIDCVAANPKGSPVEVDVVALELNLDQLPQKVITVYFVSNAEFDAHLSVGLCRAESVNTGD